jgi:hypothetical protein
MANIGRPPCDEGVVRTSRASAPCTPSSAPWVLAATIIGSAMAFIDGTITNVALPQIQERLGATAVDAQWIVTAYALFLAALILVGGSLGDHYGRRRIFLLGVGIFTVASVAYQRLLRELLRAQRRTLLELRNEGVIGDEAMHRIERDLDLEESRLGA